VGVSHVAIEAAGLRRCLRYSALASQGLRLLRNAIV
jgi:hypothetical protein